MFNQGIYHQSTQMTGGFVGGSGTLNFVSKWTPNGVTIGNSQIFDNGTNVGINISSSLGAKLHIVGAGNSSATFGLRVDSSTVSNLFFVRNDGAVSSLNGYWIGTEKVFYINPNGTIENIFIGDNSGNNTMTGRTNLGVGSSTLSVLTSGSFNIALGYQSGRSLTTASYCTSIGAQSLANNASSDSNTGVGYRTLFTTTSSQNTAIGSFAMGSTNSNGSNTAVGYNVMYSSTGTKCTGVGANVLQNQTSADYNTAIGASAGSFVTTGSSSVLIGYFAGTNVLTVGERNVIIGANATVTNAGDSESIALGYGATITGNNQFVVGSSGQNAGAVTTESVTSDQTWTVIINGVTKKILLKS